MFTLFSLPITVSGSPVANGSIVFTLVGGPATIISTGGAAPSSYTFNLDANGNPPAVMQMWGNQELTPAGTNYTYAVWNAPNGTGSIVYGPFTSIVGPSAPYAGTLYPTLSVFPLLSFGAINGVNVSGTPSSGQVLTATGPTAATWQNITVSGTGMIFNGSTSGTTTLKASAVASGTLTLPAATDTLVGKATTDTLSNKTLVAPVIGAATGTSLVVSGILQTTGSTGLTTTGTGGVIAGGFGTPSVIRHYLGDGTGWRIEFASRSASVDTLRAWITDTGTMNVTTGYQVNGTALAASNLSNGVTGSGAVVLATSPTLTTPNIGVATATSVNKVAITAPATSATLTIANSKTLTVNNTLTFAGTDSITHTFPASAPTGGVLSYGRPQFQVFTASGTFTIPTGVTAVKVTIVGAGGAGGGGTGSTAAGSGGGSGACAIKWLTGLTPGNTIAVTVGTGGTGALGAGGNTGGSSSIASGTQTITTVTAAGGTGGGASAGIAGSGGTATSGDLNFAGGAGSQALSSINSLGGHGAGSVFAGGALGGNGNATGNAGGAPGAGGGGGGGTAGNTTGGSGANGIVLFEYDF